MTYLQKVVEVALSQLGVEEKPKGTNWGPQVSEYLKSVGITFPASWCMAFVYWVHEKAAKETGVSNMMAKTGGVLNQFNKRKENFAITNPEPGDVFIMDYGKGLGHTGIVESVEGEFVHTIEGNTNDEGSREGYEVCKRKRPIAKMKGFLRFIP